MEFTNIVLNIPHSSTFGFQDGWSSYSDLFKEVKRMTDWHTDVLFKPSNDLIFNKVIPIVFPYSRFKVDVERLVDDQLESIGQGILYEITDNGCKRNLDDVEREQLMSLYHSHHDMIQKSVVDGSMLIDCHSFTASVNSDIDVCIGFNEDDTRPEEWTIDLVINEFSRYVNKSRIGINEPYSNSIVANNGKKHTSIMIELNKSLYMNEDTLELKADWYKWNAVLNSIYSKLVNSSIKYHFD